MSLQQQFPEEGYFRMDDRRWKITANHTIQEVTPTMIDWWWDHIDTTARYRLWHPTDHISFEWLIPPVSNGYVGAMHRVQEFFNGTPGKPVTLEIRWEDPKQAKAQFDHVLLATGTGEGGIMGATLMHEYEAMPGSGTRMRSHFWHSAQAPEPAIEALYRHNCQEMAYLSTFLPWLYRSEVELPLGKGYFARGEQRITRESIDDDSTAHAHFHYRLWENWQEQTYHITASSVPLLLESQQIELVKWSWHSLQEGKRV